MNITRDELRCVYLKDSETCEYFSYVKSDGRGRDVFSNIFILYENQYLEK